MVPMPNNLRPVLGASKGAAHYVRRVLASKKLSINKASELIGVNQSSLSRFLGGASLTPLMAHKLHKGLEIDVDLLFNLEAQKNAEIAKSLENS